MATSSSAQIELFVETPAQDDLRSILTEAGYAVGLRSLSQEGPPLAFHLVVIDAGGQIEAALRQCRWLRERQADGFTPILFITADASTPTRLASLECGADAILARPFEPAPLLRQVQARVARRGRFLRHLPPR
ncbi:MAG: response regulator transcription factor [Planctomycetes bacterium]|nr:response regulator transcription factor [Planctomycetota bacterium]